MGVPRDTRSLPERLRFFTEQIARLRTEITGVNRDAADNVVFVPDPAAAGVLKPRLAATVTTAAQNVTIISGTFVEAFTAAGRRQNTTWEVRFTAVCDAGTTANVRAVISGTSTELMPPTLVDDGATLAAVWVLTLPGSYDDYVSIEIQGQRVSGAGNLKIRPYSVAGG